MAQALASLEREEASASRDRWDPAFVAEQVGPDPLEILEWVRENVSWVPYRGLLRGPSGVLQDRMGNSLDRAVLLAALLESAGQATRLAHGRLDPRAVNAALAAPARLSVREAGPESSAEDESAYSSPMSRLILESVAARPDAAARHALDQLERQLSLPRNLVDLDERAERQASRLEGMLTTLPARAVAPEPTPDLDHWWVQRFDGIEWHDLDPLGGVAGEALVEPVEIVEQGSIPDDERHRLTIRVTAERWSPRGLSTQTVLSETVTPSGIVGAPIDLQLWPVGWPSDPSAAGDASPRDVALDQREWAVGLLVDGEVKAQALVDDSGAVTEGQPGGAFAALAAGFSDGRRPHPDAVGTSTLSALWIEYELLQPGRPGRALKREIFDLIGPAKRRSGVGSPTALDEAQRLQRSLALMTKTEILALVCDPAPELVAHVAARSFLANGAALTRLAGAPASLSRSAVDELFDQMAPLPSALLAQALARRPVDGLFVDRLQVFTRHVFPAVTPEGLVIREANDIVANELGVLPGRTDGFALRLRQGVRDTNVEEVFGLGEPRPGGAAVEFEQGGSWSVLGAEDRDRVASLSLTSDDRERVLQALAEGHVAVVSPRGPSDSTASTWWRIDPRTGDTLGIGDRGWGTSVTERGFWLNLLSRFSKAFFFDFFLCTGAVQSQAVESKGTAAGVDEVAGECLLDAVAIGLLATFPLVWMTVAARIRSMSRAFVLGRMPTVPALPPPETDLRDTVKDPKLGDAVADTQPGEPDTIKDPRLGDAVADTQAGEPDTIRDPEPGKGSSPAGATGRVTYADVKAAEEAHRVAVEKNIDATGDFVRYRASQGTNPSWNPEVDADLLKKANAAEQESIKALNHYRELRETFMKQPPRKP